MMRLLRVVLVPLVALALLVSACGGDDDDDSQARQSTTSVAGADGASSPDGSSPDGTSPEGSPETSLPPGDPEYCAVSQRIAEEFTADAQTSIQQQLAVAPADLRGALESLNDNIGLLQNLNEATPQERDVVLQPFIEVLTYQVRRCGVSLFRRG